MEFESLIFDIDGTLWDSRALVAEGWNRQLRAEGLAHLCVTGEGLTPLFGKVRQEIAEALFFSLPEQERDPLMIRCMESEDRYLEQNDCSVGYPGVKKTLEKLAKEYRLFIVSNGQKGYPALCIEKMGLSHLIEGHLCYGDTGTCKGETILKLMKDHHIRSASYIGDTQGDADAAALAGIPFVYCAYGFGRVESCWKTIGNVEDLLNIF